MVLLGQRYFDVPDYSFQYETDTAKCPTDEYCAGYFDGEGCVNFYERLGGMIPRIRMGVESANVPCLLALQIRFGGTVILASKPSYRRKSLYQWRIGSIRDCLAFARAVEPHSIEKRVQIVLAREWLEYRLAVPRRCRNAADTAELIHRTRATMLSQKKMDFFVFPLPTNAGMDYEQKLQ